MQPDITAFQSQFNGAFPFRSDGIVIGTPDARVRRGNGVDDRLRRRGSASTPGGLYHENMHQWWGDNVSEGDYRTTFYKEGMATLGEFLYQARLAENKAGGPTRRPGRPRSSASLVKQFDST